LRGAIFFDVWRHRLGQLRQEGGRPKNPFWCRRLPDKVSRGYRIKLDTPSQTHCLAGLSPGGVKRVASGAIRTGLLKQITLVRPARSSKRSRPRSSAVNPEYTVD